MHAPCGPEVLAGGFKSGVVLHSAARVESRIKSLAKKKGSALVSLLSLLSSHSDPCSKMMALATSGAQFPGPLGSIGCRMSGERFLAGRYQRDTLFGGSNVPGIIGKAQNCKSSLLVPGVAWDVFGKEPVRCRIALSCSCISVPGANPDRAKLSHLVLAPGSIQH